MGRTIEADYLVVGAGAMGMAFVDTLVSETDATVVVVDRNHQPGGHWTTAYPFVRLHQPSAYYGVNSRDLGSDTIDHSGLNAGYYELAGGAEVCAYFDAVMQQQLLPTGRVTYLPMSEYLGDGRVRTLGGDEIEVTARRVVTTHVNIVVPSMRPPSYAVAPGVDCVPPNDLPRIRDARERYVIVGAGKTAMDACLWLLRHGIAPQRLTWIKPRDSWILDRAAIQPGRQFAKRTLADFSGQLAAVHEAESLEDLFDRLEAKGCLLRIDTAVDPTMYRCAILSQAELEALREIDDVVRMGHVQSVEPGRVTLDGRDARRRRLCALHRLHRRWFRPEGTNRGIQRRPHLAADGAHLPAGVQRGRHRPRRSGVPRRQHQERVLQSGAVSAGADRLAANDAGVQRNQLKWFSDPDMMAWVDAARLNVLHHVTAAVSERAREKIISVLTSQLPAINDKLEKLLAQA